MKKNKYFYHDHLESDRLKTRFLTPEDAVIWTEFFKDEEALRYLIDYDSPTPEGKARLWINKQLKRYQEQQYGLQALIDKNTNEFVGQCGLLAQEVDGKEELEVGYHVLKKYWGQGYAPEAAKLFMDYAFKNDLSDSIISIIEQNNIKSQRVANKNGLALEKATTWSGLSVFIYRISKP